MATLLNFPASAMFGDDDAQLVAGDVPAPYEEHAGRPALSFDDTAEEAALTPEVTMPSQYNGSGLKAIVHFYMAFDVTNDVAIDVFVEAITPNADTLDMEATASWATANSGTKSVSGTTAGDLLTLEITLTNADGVAAGDMVRFGVRRDTDSVNDDAAGDMFIAAIEIVQTMARKQSDSSQYLATVAASVAGIDVSQVTISFRIKVDGAGAATDFLQLIDNSASAFRYRLRYSAGNTGKFRITFELDWSTTNGIWIDNTDTDYANGAWHTFFVTYDRGSTTNNPVYFLNSTTTKKPSESSTPAGTVETGQNTVELFRNGFTGTSRIISLAEVPSVWDRILTSSEIGTVIQHAPSFVRRGLQFYAPLIRGLGERIQGNALSVGSGTTVVDHPSVIRPAGNIAVPAAATAGGTILSQITAAYHRMNA